MGQAGAGVPQETSTSPSDALFIGVQHLGGAIEGVRQHGNLLLRAFQISLINRLVHTRNNNRGVAGILPRSVALRYKQCAFRITQCCV